MTIETLKKKLAAALPMYETMVNKRGECCQITVKLRHQAELVGFYPLNLTYEEIGLDAIAKQCAVEEAKNVANTVYIIEGCRVILRDAFKYCRMSEVVIPSSVKSIQGYAFEACHDLKRVSGGDGLKKIGRYAFNYCTSLESFLIADSVVEIGENAFAGCGKLTQVHIPSHLNCISDSLFYRCSSLVSVTIPENVSVIGKDSFSDCKSLQKIHIPEGVFRIEEQAFAKCDSLVNLIIPTTVGEIGPYAFAGCKSLKNVTILSTYLEIEEGAFKECPVLERVSLPQNISEFEYIPSELFRGCSSLMEFVIPSTVKSVGDEAFKDCSSLGNITLPDGVTTIGRESFSGCSLIDNITIPSSVTQIGAMAFWRTGNQTPIIHNNVLNYVPENTYGKFIVPDGVERIEECAFLQKDITDIVLPDSVKEIGKQAFEGCVKLQSVDIPSQVWVINVETFCDCTSLAQVTLPENLEVIEEKAFKNCAFHKIVLPGKVSNIGIKSFLDCKALCELTITQAIPVDQIARSAFFGCSALARVNLPKGLTWSKLKDRFWDSPWGKNKPVKLSAAAAKRQKMDALENASYKVKVDAILAPNRTQVIVENTSVKVLAELPYKSFIVAEFSLIDQDCHKIQVTEFQCDALKKLMEIAQPNTTYWLLPQGTIIRQHMTQWARSFTCVTDNLVLLPGIKGIEDHAFEGFKGLRHVMLPDTVTSIGQQCFANTDLEEALILNGILVCAPIGSLNPSYTIPDTVRFVAPYAFEGYKVLEEVIIPSSVEVISENAFSECLSLRRAVFANPVKFHSFFKDRMNRIKTVTDKDYTTIDYTAFYNCEALTDFVVPNPGALLGSLISGIYLD